MTKPLSPAAQQVFWEFNRAASGKPDDWHYLPAIAAALRAAADQVLAVQWEGRIEPDTAHSLGINWTRDALHAIAAELEGGR
jgi:hypothetical protein